MIESLLILLVLVALPISIAYIGYRRTKKPQGQKPAVVHEPKDKIMLHNHDLAKWNYLGFTRCSYVDENGKITGEYPIFLFVSKNDEKRRSYYISGDTGGHVNNNHSFVNKYIKTWAAGEGEIYHRVQGEHSNPSDYLKSYMLDKFGAVWDDATHWWDTNDKAKYTAANNKQKRERKKTEAKPESNVVTVDFGKQA